MQERIVGLRGWGLVGLLWVVVVALSNLATPALATHPYYSQGTIDSPSGGFSKTLQAFLVADCEYPPEFQGLDAWIFELPADFSLPAPFQIKGESGTYDLDAFFVTKACTQSATFFATASPDESGTIPSETQWVVADLFDGANVRAFLCAGVSRCPADIPTSNPSHGSSSTASGSASASASASPSSSPARPQVSTSLATSRTRVAYRRAFVLSGTLQASAPGCGSPSSYTVQLLHRIHGRDTDFAPLGGPIPVADDGTWSFVHRSEESASYAAQVSSTQACSGQRSQTVDTLVRAKIKIVPRRRCNAPQKVPGSVLPNHSGTRVALQRRAKGGWRGVDLDRLNRDSRFLLRAPRCRATYRVHWAAQADNNLAAKRLIKP